MRNVLFDKKDIPKELHQYFEEVQTECGAPWERITEKKYPETRKVQSRVPNGQTQQGLLGNKRFDEPIESKTIGWKQNCGCNLDPGQIPIPCTILDIFGGSGTVALVAYKLRRKAILVELSEEYAGMAKERIEKVTRQGWLF